MDNFEFLEVIANGFNPITGEKFAESDILINPRVSLRLINLVRELRRDSVVGCEVLKRNFIYSPEMCNNVNITVKKTIGEFASSITQSINKAKKCELFNRSHITNRICNYLVSNNILERVHTSKNRFKCVVSEFGLQNGFTNYVDPEKDEIERTKIICNAKAQEYILFRLPEIFNQNLNNNPSQT